MLSSAGREGVHKNEVTESYNTADEQALHDDPLCLSLSLPLSPSLSLSLYLSLSPSLSARTCMQLLMVSKGCEGIAAATPPNKEA